MEAEIAQICQRTAFVIFLRVEAVKAFIFQPCISHKHCASKGSNMVTIYSIQEAAQGPQWLQKGPTELFLPENSVVSF
jgi:hypothetical protein